MYRLYGAIGVLCCVLVLIFTGFYINAHTAAYVQDKLRESYDDLKNGDLSSAKNNLSLAQQEWEDKSQCILLFVSHGKADDIEEAINTAVAFLDNGQQAFFYESCSKAILLLDHFKNEEYPEINNIL